jgi:hypothetical protein
MLRLKTSTKALAIILALALCGGVLAHSSSYDPSGDIRINVNAPRLSPLTSALSASGVGSLLFNVQEDAHSTLTRQTGISLPHSYIRTCINSLCLPVDPLRFGR